jgi:hypothetical protein
MKKAQGLGTLLDDLQRLTAMGLISKFYQLGIT